MSDKLHFNHCFVCGPENPSGLHIHFTLGDKKAWCQWTVLEDYVGYSNMLHGGIMSAIMDDLMGHATYSMNVDVVTAHLEMDYRSPAYVGDVLDCSAWVTEVGTGRSMKVEGEIYCGDRLIAQGKSVVVIGKRAEEDGA